MYARLFLDFLEEKGCVFMRLFSTKPIRKTVNMSERTADNLEQLAKVSGLPQGEILEMALSTGPMQLLMVFGTKDIRAPIAQLLDLYQANGEARMTQEVTEGFVNMLLYKILPRVYVWPSKDRTDAMTAVSLNEYLASHMGNHGVDKLPGFAECKLMAEENKFLLDMGENYEEISKKHIERYLRTMLAYMDDVNVYANDYLIRNLVVIFRDFCPDIAGFADRTESLAFQYRACAEVMQLLVPFSLDL